MAQPYCSGPVDAWVIPEGYGSAQFLGHNQVRGPRISIRRGWETLFVDLSGPQIPYDLIYTGQEAWVTIELSRYNQNVLEALQLTAFAKAGGQLNPGTDWGGDRGTIMITEGANSPLYLRFPFSAAGAFPHAAMNNATNGALPSGMRFPGAIYKGPDERQTGVGANFVMVTFHCLSTFDPATGKFTLFDYGVSGLGNIN